MNGRKVQSVMLLEPLVSTIETIKERIASHGAYPARKMRRALVWQH